MLENQRLAPNMGDENRCVAHGLLGTDRELVVNLALGFDVSRVRTREYDLDDLRRQSAEHVSQQDAVNEDR